jgi:hypothetical protein
MQGCGRVSGPVLLQNVTARDTGLMAELPLKNSEKYREVVTTMSLFQLITIV